MDLEAFAALSFPYGFEKSNPGIHDASKHLNREINSQLDPIIFDLGIHSVDKRMIRVLLDILFQYNVMILA